jgi:glycosyltransferase involved in cell wall biosynthesis
MLGLKQLVAVILGHEATVRSYTPASINYAETANHRGESEDRQLQGHRDMFAMLNGGLAPTVPPAPAEYGPKFSICRDFGPSTISLILRRSLLPRDRILLCLKQIPPSMGAVHRFVLAGVDAVLVETDAMARTLREFGLPASRIVSLADPGDLALFIQTPQTRIDADVCRIIHVGDLEPEAGVAELLPCLALWAAQHPDHKIEIVWAGEGCLRGVLEAQPLPANIKQQFPGDVSRAQLASLFLECDMLAVPALSDPWSSVVPEAVAAQLPVLGSSRSQTVVDLVTHGSTGWIFDPFEADAMARAVDLALSAPPHELDDMRAHAAAQFRKPLPGLNERLLRAMRMEAFEQPLNTASFGFAS